MKHKHLMSFGVAVIAVCALHSCSSDPYIIPSEELFTRAFIERFGLIDQSQDWNIAERKAVTVRVNGPEQVKVYAEIDNKYYLVANYKDVTGVQTLPFDVPEGTTNIKVAINGQKVDAKVGDTVDLTQTQSRASGTYTTPSGSITVTELLDEQYKSNWLRMPASGVLSYNDIVPEYNDNRDVTGVSKNFLYVSNGPFVIHPIYWHTNQTNVIGLYYYDNSGDGVMNYEQCKEVKIKHIPIYTIRGGNTVLYYADMATVGEDNIETSTSLTTGQQISYIKKEYEGWTLIGQEAQSVRQTLTSVVNITGEITDDERNSTVQLMSKGIKVDIPKGMQFGMYIQRGDGTKYYSQSELNSDAYYEREYSGTNKHKSNKKSEKEMPWQACHAASFRGSEAGALALMFEDWPDTNKDSDMDLNDMVFVFFGADPDNLTQGTPILTPVDDVVESPYQWILAAEDLGAFDDFDFNDVVVGIEYVSGETTAKLTALAAGGTLPVKLLYNGEVVCSSDGQEQFHSWFKGNPSKSTMINTIRMDHESKTPTTLTVPSNFSLATVDSNDKWTTAYTEGRMGGFSLQVERADGTFDEITAPGRGAAPQMICIPGGWAWPKERAGITDAYLQFESWISSPSEYSEWYKGSYDRSQLLADPQFSTGSTGGNTGETPGGSTETSSGPEGIGDSFSVPAPTGDRAITAQGGYGYVNVVINFSELSEDNVLLKAAKHYSTNRTNASYKHSFINALLAHYWDKVFYAPEDGDALPQSEYYDGDTPYLVGTKFGSGKTFMLVDVMHIWGISFDYTSANSKANIIVKVQQIESDGTSGGGNQDDNNPGGGTQTPVGTPLTVTEVTSSYTDWWGYSSGHKLYKISGVSTDDSVTITINNISSSSGNINTGATATSTNDWIGYIKDNGTVTAKVTVPDIGDNDYFFAALYNGDTIESAVKTN